MSFPSVQSLTMFWFTFKKERSKAILQAYLSSQISLMTMILCKNHRMAKINTTSLMKMLNNKKYLFLRQKVLSSPQRKSKFRHKKNKAALLVHTLLKFRRIVSQANQEQMDGKKSIKLNKQEEEIMCFQRIKFRAIQVIIKIIKRKIIINTQKIQ